jgi:4-phytase/acid phosphatase
LPDDFDTTKKGTFKWTGSFPVGSTDSENFLLEYANGMPCNILGWGRVAYDSTKPDCNPAGQPFRTMQRIHTLYFDLVNRHQYLATIQGSNLANQVLLKLTQGADGQAPAPLVIYAGHDSNIANIAGMLKLHWTLPDLPEDDTPPAGALVFELYEGKTPKDLYVKLKYVHATMAQMRAQTVLSVSTPPDRAGITIPDCADPCSFSQFQAIMSRAIDQSFVTQDPHPKH